MLNTVGRLLPRMDLLTAGKRAFKLKHAEVDNLSINKLIDSSAVLLRQCDLYQSVVSEKVCLTLDGIPIENGCLAATRPDRLLLFPGLFRNSIVMLPHLLLPTAVTAR